MPFLTENKSLRGFDSFHMHKFCISQFQREFLSIQKTNHLYSACLTSSLVSSSVLTQLKIEHKITPGFLCFDLQFFLDHYWIQANGKDYDFTAFPEPMLPNRLTYHLEKPMGKEYLIESELEKMERDALLREWERIRHLPVAIGLALHFDGMFRLIGDQHRQAWKSALDELNQYLISNSFHAKIKYPQNKD